MIGPLFYMFTGAMFIFSSVRFLNMCKPRTALQMKFTIFQGCPIKQAVFLHGQPAPYNQLLIQSLLLVPKCYSALNVETRVLKFSAHFSQNAVFIGCNIFFTSFGYQFELMFVSYNQLPGTTYLTLYKPYSLCKHLKGHQVIGFDLSTSPMSKDLFLDSI